MKASVPLLGGCVAVGLTLAVTESWASPLPTGLWAVAVASAGQIGGGRDKRAESDKLLSQAQKAIKQGDYAQAESLIGQAEKLGVKYHPLTERFVETPDKVRKALAEARSKAAASRAVARAPALLESNPTQKQPSAIPLDPIAAAPQAANPPTYNVGDDPVPDDAKSRAVMYLQDARQLLTAGDKLAALAAWQKAAAIGAAFAANEVSPQTVAEELKKAGIDPSRLVAAAPNPASPYMLRPSDVEAAGERVPELAGTPAATAPPAAATPDNFSPYNLPAESNPLAQGGPRAGGAFQPAAAPVATTITDDQTTPAPQRLPVGDVGGKAQAARLIAQARVALDKGDVKGASQLAEQAEALNVPDDAFEASETRPWQMVLEITRAQYRREGVAQVSANAPAGGELRYPVAQGIYDPAADTTRTVPANSQVPLPPPPSVLAAPVPMPVPTPVPLTTNPADGQQLYEEGLRAFQAQDRETALRKFAEAWRYESQLDPETRRQLKDKLTLLRAANLPSAARPYLPASSLRPWSR